MESETVTSTTPSHTPSIETPPLSIPLPQRIGVINGLRALACILVVLAHTPLWHASQTHQTTFMHQWEESSFLYSIVSLFTQNFIFYSIMSNAGLAVNLFFLLSGFVLYYPYCRNATDTKNSTNFIHIKNLLDEKSGSKFSISLDKRAVLSFWKKRALRLLPLYYFSLLIYVMLFKKLDHCSPQGETDMHRCDVNMFSLSNFQNIAKLFSYLSFTFIFVGEYHPQYYPAFWSIAFEFWFSLLFPIIIICLYYVTQRLQPYMTKLQLVTVRQQRIFALSVFCGVVYLILSFVRFVRFSFGFYKSVHPIHGSVGEEFILGMLLAEFYIFIFQSVDHSSVVVSVKKQQFKRPFIILVSGISILLVCFFCTDSIRYSYDSNISLLIRMLKWPLIRSLLNVLLGMGLFCFLLGSLLLKPIAWQQVKVVLERPVFKFAHNFVIFFDYITYLFLSNRLMQLIGKMCFSVYVWHGWFAHYMFFVPLASSSWQVLQLWLIQVPLFTIVLFCISSMSYYYIEFKEKNFKELFLTVCE